MPAMPAVYKKDWKDVSKIIVDIFKSWGLQIFSISQELKISASLLLKLWYDFDIVNDCSIEKEVATDFSTDEKNLCRPQSNE